MTSSETTHRTRIVDSVKDLRQEISKLRGASASCEECSVGLVPTMGALHEGHLSLVKQSQSECDATVVTIFVNPTQFGPGEDLAAYPRPLQTDLQLLEEQNVDLVYVPKQEEIYPAGFSTLVQPPDVAIGLEGELRPNHFRGVATIVLKLLNLTHPDVAFFGQKDYQQSLVIRQMVRDLNVPVEIRTCPTVRDAGGLALSSRNIYLTAEQRSVALSLSRCLQRAAGDIADGERDAAAIAAQMKQTMIESGVTKIDYVVVADPDSLAAVETISAPVVLLVAARIGTTRLIDNTPANPKC